MIFFNTLLTKDKLQRVLPSSLSLRVIPMGSSVFLWNWTNLTRVTFSTYKHYKTSLVYLCINFIVNIMSRHVILYPSLV